MNYKRKYLSFCTIILVSVSLLNNFSIAEEDAMSDYNLDIHLKKTVENELGIFKNKLLEKRHINKKAVYPMLKKYLRDKPKIYGAAFAFGPDIRNKQQIKSSPYVFRDGKKFIEKDLLDSYDYTMQDWYAIPANLKKPVWSKPYFDDGGGEAWMITYSIPLYSDRNKTKFIGVVTSDVLIPTE